MEREVRNQNEQLMQNIKILEQGISLNEYLKREEEIKINGSLEIYKKFGVLIFLNETRKLFELNFDEETLQRYVLDSNSNIYRHYQRDEILLKFHKYNNDEELKKIVNYYDSKYQRLEIYHFNKTVDVWRNEKQYRNRKKLKSTKLRIIAIPLLQLKSKNSFLYELCNAIADLLVKPIPIFICLMISNRGQIFVGMNMVQKLLYGVVSIVGMYTSSILIYLSIFIFVKIVMLVLFREISEVKFKIFDKIIGLTEISWKDFE